MTVHAGWYMAAFTDEITDDVTPLRIGDRRLMIIRSGEGVEATYRVTDASCPHRGASLAHGGRLDGKNCIVCPFHGRRIGLGSGRDPWVVHEYDCFNVGPMLFVRLGTGPDGECRFRETFEQALGERTVHVAVNADVHVPVEYIVENAFDNEHFGPVHHVPQVQGMTTHLHDDGHLTIGADFITKCDPWADVREGVALQEVSRLDMNGQSGFRATAFSPTLVVTAFGSTGRDPLIITSAMPHEEGCRVRVAVAGFPDQPVAEICTGSRMAIAQDTEVWQHVDFEAPWNLDTLDDGVMAFRSFVRDFPLMPAVPRVNHAPTVAAPAAEHA